MTHRERILAILEGRAPDRIPWIPRLKIWYEANRLAGTLPRKYKGKTLQEVERDIFGTIAARDGALWSSKLRGVEVRRREVGQMETVTEYVTPVGTVATRHRGTERLRSQGIADVQLEFMLKRREDYPVVRYLVEHTQYTPTFEEYDRYDRAVGDQSYPLVKAGDCPFHYWMLELAGYNQAFYHLNDFPDEVEGLVAVLTDRYKQTIWKYMHDSSARLIQHGIHLSSHMTPPPLFEKYIVPYFQELTKSLRERGKIVAMHADNDTTAILSLIEKAGFGMVECFVTSPMVSTTLAEARAAWGDRVIIWGGVPSAILEDPYTDEQFEEYMDDLFRTIAPGKAFILGIADNAMPGAKLERIRRITQLVEQRGQYPIE